LRHIVERGIELNFLSAQQLGRVLAIARVSIELLD
jgi:hypothetical protein